MDAEGRIRALGYETRVEERTVEVVLMYLGIGGYRTADEVAGDLNTLRQKGFSTVILKGDQ